MIRRTLTAPTTGVEITTARNAVDMGFIPALLTNNVTSYQYLGGITKSDPTKTRPMLSAISHNKTGVPNTVMQGGRVVITFVDKIGLKPRAVPYLMINLTLVKYSSSIVEMLCRFKREELMTPEQYRNALDMLQNRIIEPRPVISVKVPVRPKYRQLLSDLAGTYVIAEKAIEWLTASRGKEVDNPSLAGGKMAKQEVRDLKNELKKFGPRQASIRPSTYLQEVLSFQNRLGILSAAIEPSSALFGEMARLERELDLRIEKILSFLIIKRPTAGTDPLKLVEYLMGIASLKMARRDHDLREIYKICEEALVILDVGTASAIREEFEAFFQKVTAQMRDRGFMPHDPAPSNIASSLDGDGGGRSGRVSRFATLSERDGDIN